MSLQAREKRQAGQRGCGNALATGEHTLLQK